MDPAKYNEYHLLTLYDLSERPLSTVISQIVIQMLSKAFASLLFARSTTPPFLETIFIYSEFILFLAATSQSQLHIAMLDTQDFSLFILLFLSLLLLLRYILALTFIRCFYVVLLYLLSSVQVNATIIACYILLTTLLLVDTLSKISLQPGSFHGEQYNSRKLCHYALLAAGVLLRGQRVIVQAAMIAGLVALFTLTLKSLIGRLANQELFLRLYLLGIFTSALNLLACWVNLSQPIVVVVAAVTSQATFALYRRTHTEETLDEYLSQDKHDRVIFIVLRYIQSDNYDSQMEEQIKSLAGTVNAKLQPSPVYARLLELLPECNEVKAYVLKGYVCLLQGKQINRCKLLSQKAAGECAVYSLFGRVLLYRLQQSMSACYKSTRERLSIRHESEYFSNENFKNLLLKSTGARVSMWEYTTMAEVNHERMMQLLTRTVNLEQQVKTAAKALTKCVSVSWLYCAYLLDVMRDKQTAAEILQELKFNQEFFMDLHMEEKIFVNIELEQLRITKVGANVSNVLGYKIKEIETHSLSMLLPAFYEEQHQTAALEQIESCPESMFLYSKHSIVKNKHRYYEPANILLTLHLSHTGDLHLSGSIHVMSQSTHQMHLHDINHPEDCLYDWSQYLLIHSNQKIIECSPHILEMLPPTAKITSVVDFFDTAYFPNKPLHRTVQDEVILFHAYTFLNIPDGTAILMVRVDKGQATPAAFKGRVDALQKEVNVPDNSLNQYRKKVDAIKQEIGNRKELLYNLAIFTLLCLTISLEIFQLVNSQTTRVKNEQVVDSAYDLVLYYDSAIKLGIDINYLTIRHNYNYSNSFFQAQIIPMALRLQTVNELLKQYGRNSFAVPNTQQSFSNYELILNFEGDAFTFSQFPLLRSFSIDKISNEMLAIFGSSISDYDLNFLASLTSSAPVRALGLILICAQLVCFVAAFVLLVFLEDKARAEEKQVIEFIGSVHSKDQYIAVAKQFACHITLQQLKSHHRPQGNSHVGGEAQNEFSRSEFSLRESSGRNLMEESLTKPFGQSPRSNYSRKHRRVSLLEGKVPEAASNHFQIAMRPRKKWVFISLTIAVLAIISLALLNQISNGYLRFFDAAQSATSLLSLLRTSTIYSRCTVALLTSLNAPFSPVAPLNAVIALYNSTVAQYPVFSEASYPEFSTFASKLSQIRYQYLCTYVDCLPAYTNQVNIIYSTTIQKMMNFVINISSAMVGLNSSQRNQLVQTYASSLDAILYTEQIVRDVINGVVNDYVAGFSAYVKSNYSAKSSLLTAILGLMGLLLIAFVFYSRIYLRNQSNLLESICDIIKLKKGEQASFET